MAEASIAERGRTAQQIDRLIDGAAYWQMKWRRDGTKLTHVLLCADLEIVQLRQQLRANGIEPVDGERTRRHRVDALHRRMARRHRGRLKWQPAM